MFGSRSFLFLFSVSSPMISTTWIFMKQQKWTCFLVECWLSKLDSRIEIIEILLENPATACNETHVIFLCFPAEYWASKTLFSSLV